MAADRPPELWSTAGLRAFRIAAGDTVKLAVLRHPDNMYDACVVFEVWDVGGAQPPNSHPGSVETFYFLAGSGMAYCDEHSVRVGAGQLLVLPPSSVHRVVNTGPGRLYAITTMVHDNGFAHLIESGVPAPLDEQDMMMASGLSPGTTSAHSRPGEGASPGLWPIAGGQPG